MRSINPFDSKVSFILVRDDPDQDGPVPLSTTAQVSA